MGSNTQIFNLKAWNKYLRPKKYRLVNHLRIPDIFQPKDYMLKIDTKYIAPVLSDLSEWTGS